MALNPFNCWQEFEEICVRLVPVALGPEFIFLKSAQEHEVQTVRFATVRCGVALQLAPMDDFVSLFLTQIGDSGFPPYPNFQINWKSMTWVQAAFLPAFVNKPLPHGSRYSPRGEISRELLEECVRYQLTLVIEFGADFLLGSFERWPLVQQFIWSRSDRPLA